MKEFNGKLLMLTYDKDNKVTTINPQCINIITERNRMAVQYLCTLIGETITDLDSYPKIPQNEYENIVQEI